MKTIGLIGGMSWESSSLYYSIINREVRRLLGKSHSASCIMYSFDFQGIEEKQYAGQWEELEAEMVEAGLRLKSAGADFIVLCTNTMHKLMDRFEEKVGLPFLHIADVAAESMKEDGLSAIGLLGTKFTMGEDFYKKRIHERYGLTVLVPDDNDQEEVNRIIYKELVRGIVKEESRKKYEEIIDRLVERGAQGIILGCTEIGILIKEHRCPLYDTTLIHALKAARMSVQG
ncbi:MAG TPA: aspartate/glutamate racemase family protein [Candidatus Mcinerneyibacteriales bacterium]|nr:aspartate/glutamate racemase family protein [Candidatus Mcinerneyibacteriales bacterium]HPJ69295.1 aspartate/glutamate racemase family protein [Candidatus Mcinerneyibacteriales bacterium]HPQ88542.1 aspartate/glutamate racemase family protein [Candidatus Mcinerneyibacteriales bacterium]